MNQLFGHACLDVSEWFNLLFAAFFARLYEGSATIKNNDGLQ